MTPGPWRRVPTQCAATWATTGCCTLWRTAPRFAPLSARLTCTVPRCSPACPASGCRGCRASPPRWWSCCRWTTSGRTHATRSGARNLFSGQAPSWRSVRSLPACCRPAGASPSASLCTATPQALWWSSSPPAASCRCGRTARLGCCLSICAARPPGWPTPALPAPAAAGSSRRNFWTPSGRRSGPSTSSESAPCSSKTRCWRAPAGCWRTPRVSRRR
mmetsp:Transcript_29179/g.82291  ORF Transcript_29179/g.82291 Transcript_29179/m.82291 type:complete len:218 (+) Transcript_29179:821-1474(+)